MSTVYEWVVEATEDEYGDIEDMDHEDTYAQALKTAEAWKQHLKPGYHLEIALTRLVIDDEDGNLEDRQYAYIGWEEDGRLPAKFDGGAAVPKRCHAELLR